MEEENKKSCEIEKKCEKKDGDTEEKGETRVVDMQPPQVSSSGGLFEYLVRDVGGAEDSTYFMQGF